MLYTGTYISDTNKIGHEIINMFKDDLGRNYIYVTPYGNIADVHDNQIDAVVMVRIIGDKCVEIIAKAEMLEQVAFSRDNDISASQRNYGTKPIILLDEYDATIQHAWENGFYDELIQ